MRAFSSRVLSLLLLGACQAAETGSDRPRVDPEPGFAADEIASGSVKPPVEIEPWYAPPPSGSGYDPWSWPAVAPRDIHPVLASMQNRAERLLAEHPASPLSDSEAVSLVGAPVEAPAGERLYLLRGLYLNEGTGHYSVRHRDGQVFVAHGSLGRTEVPLRRRALVVPLPEAPDTVYVYAFMDE